MKVELIDIILFVLFFQLLSIAPFLLFQKRPNSLANQILGCFVLAKALCISNFIAFRMYPYTIRYFPHLFFFGSSFTLLWGPLLYFYTRSMTVKDFRFKKRDVLHFLPILIHIGYLTARFHLHSAETKRALVAGQVITTPLFNSLYNLYLFGSIFIYTLLAFYLVWIYRIKIRQFLSSIEKQQLSWLLLVLSGFFVKWGLDLWFYIALKSTGSMPYLPLIASRIILFLFINVLIYKAMKQPQLFAGIPDKGDSRKLSLSKSMSAQYLKKLSAYMDSERPYLNPDISLEDLSELVDIPPRSLSEVINIELGKNFYDFINSYRIQESQRMLSDQSSIKKTVLEVLYDVGFNSKSAFNSSFKKYTGVTPIEFKKNPSLNS